MPAGDVLKRWRRLDEPGLEVLRLREAGDGIAVRSTVAQAGEQPFGLSYAWALDGSWRTRSLRLDLRAGEDRSLLIERSGPASWRVDGTLRTDLDGCDEVDVSATPFCNSLSIRHLGSRSGELTALYVDLPDLAPVASCQRYEARGNGRWLYVDLGAHAGFEAVLDLADDGLVRSYEGLFEAI